MSFLLERNKRTIASNMFRHCNLTIEIEQLYTLINNYYGNDCEFFFTKFSNDNVLKAILKRRLGLGYSSDNNDITSGPFQYDSKAAGGLISFTLSDAIRKEISNFFEKLFLNSISTLELYPNYFISNIVIFKKNLKDWADSFDFEVSFLSDKTCEFLDISSANDVDSKLYKLKNLDIKYRDNLKEYFKEYLIETFYLLITVSE